MTDVQLLDGLELVEQLDESALALLSQIVFFVAAVASTLDARPLQLLRPNWRDPWLETAVRIHEVAAQASRRGGPHSMEAGAVGAFLANTLCICIVEAIGTDELCDLPASPWAGLAKHDQLLQLWICGSASAWELLQVGLICSVHLIGRVVVSLSEYEQNLVKYVERLAIATQIEADAAHARFAVRVLQLPNLLVHDHSILRFLQQPWVGSHEESTKRVEREKQNERLPRLPDARCDVPLHLVASARARRANHLGVLTDEQARRSRCGIAALDARIGQEQRWGVLQPCAALCLPKAPSVRLLVGMATGRSECEDAPTVWEECGEFSAIAVGDDGVALRVGKANRTQGRGVGAPVRTSAAWPAATHQLNSKQ